MSAVTDRLIELVSALVEIPTHEREEEAQRLIATWLEECGFRCELQAVAPGRPNLVARRGDGGPFLCSHVDVHPAHDHPDAFRVRHEDDTIIGRGVLDAKGQIAALVCACEAAADAPALVAITCDEERGGLGSAGLRLPDGPWAAHGGIVLEPTDFSVCTAQSGHIDLVVRAAATPVHAYAPEGTGSPVAAVLAAVDALETSSFLAARHPLLPPPRLHVGRIHGGEHLWRRPARASAEVALGLVPGIDFDRAQDEVRGRLDDLGRRWTSRGADFSYDIVDASEPIEVAADLPVVGRLEKALGEQVQPAGMPSWTDAGYLLLRHGLPCVVFGAGDLTPAHSDHEWVRVGDLQRLSEVLARLIADYG